MGAKGKPKTGGRVRGSPNKPTQDLLQKCADLGCDPFDILQRIAMGDWEGLGYEEANFAVSFTADGNAIERERITLQDRAKAASELCQYLYPKRKALENSGSIGNDDRPLEPLTNAELKALLEKKP